jgi:anti-anti-sigma factor
VINEVPCSQSPPGETRKAPEATLAQGIDDRLMVCPASGSSDCASGEIPVKVGGELGIGNAEDLRRLFAESIGQGPDLAVDLAEVRTCDTAVLQLIWSLRKTAVRHGKRLRISGISAAIESIVAVLGMPMQELMGDNGRPAEHCSPATGESSREL